MSDDEEGPSIPGPVGGRRRTVFVIVRPNWRNAELVDWLHTLDLLDLSGKWQVNGVAKRGRFMRERVDSDRTADGKVVRGLPINMYSLAYRNKLTDYQLAQLHMRDPVELQHTAAVKK